MNLAAIGHTGVFIVFEGGEGVGKSTQINLLRASLQEQFAADGAQVELITTREPGGTRAAEALRDVALNPEYSPLDARAEALVFAAARADHAAHVIAPALARGAVVLCDRYIDSSVVYQGIARGLGADEVERLSIWATSGLLADTVIVLDLPVDIGLSRIHQPDRLEDAGVDFHERVRRGFLERAAADPQRYVVVDATASVEDVAAAVLEAVTTRHGGARA